ncbi:MAG: hypothetical protein LBR10_12975 [Prevotellaceae bacterium]|jgi:hypothetical protein|nr:hypothetical protein [Prevotellaceae bacterium]
MDIYEKAGDFIIDLAKLVFGGVILGAIMMETTNTVALYIVGAALSAIFISSGFFLYWIQKRKNKK